MPPATVRQAPLVAVLVAKVLLMTVRVMTPLGICVLDEHVSVPGLVPALAFGVTQQHRWLPRSAAMIQIGIIARIAAAGSCGGILLT